MSLRNSYAAVLQLLRTQQGLTQADISGAVTQAHVSALELMKASVTVDAAYDLAGAMKIEPSSMFILTLASHEERTAREVLHDCLAELEKLGLADKAVPTEPRKLPRPATVDAKKKWVVVQELRARGLTQSQAAKELGMAESTLRRLWHQGDAGKAQSPKSQS